ncbi:hypothetical protein Vafri_16890, partial [Volvox africanus]
MAEQYMVSDDPMLIVECQSTAIQLLALPAGREALEGLGEDNHIHRHLRIYLPSTQQQQQQQQQGQQMGDKVKDQDKDANELKGNGKTCKEATTSSSATAGAGDGGNEDTSLPGLGVVSEHMLWRVPPPAAGGTDMWLRRLTPALLGLVTDPALRLMRGLARLQSAICEALFPALLQHLITSTAAKDPTLLSHLARQIQQQVLLPQPPQKQQQQLPPQQAPLIHGPQSNMMVPSLPYANDGDAWASGDLRAVQIVLRSLEHLRRLHRRVVSERKPLGSKGAPGGPGRPEWESAVDRWEYVYGLEIDYLAVARAAIRCRQPATAMLYVGHWAEKVSEPIRVAHRLHADRQQAAAAGGQGKGTSGGGAVRQGGSKQRGATSPPPPPSSPAQEMHRQLPFENSAVQGGVHSALQVLPLCRPQPPNGTTDALSIALDAYGVIEDPDALYALPSAYMLIGNGSNSGGGGADSAAGGGGIGGGTTGVTAAVWGSGGHPEGHQLSMRLFEREGLWPHALSEHDLELRPTVAARPGQLYNTASGSRGSGRRNSTAAAAGIVSALRNL